MADEELLLFDLSTIPVGEKVLELKKPDAPVWTHNKAALIRNYLQYFVYITKHGTYIDAFSAPQAPKHADVSCAAKLVLESKPKFLRTFVLLDKSHDGIKYLTALKMQHEQGNRTVAVIKGDSNKTIRKYLRDNPIKDSEASFCLFDQRTFECDWATVVEVAKHKKGGNKVELFYFLAQGWIDRSITALKKAKAEDMKRWWGNDDWPAFKEKKSLERGLHAAERFKTDLGYKYAYPYPIYEKVKGRGKVMFWMIHASDHDEAPKLMVRAYRNAVASLEVHNQTLMELGGLENGVTTATHEQPAQKAKRSDASDII